MAEDLFYKPILKPKRDYMSDAEIDETGIDTGTDGPGDADDSFDDLSELKEKVDDILDVLDILPGDIKNALRPSLNRIRQNIYDIIPPSSDGTSGDGGSGEDSSDVGVPSLPASQGANPEGITRTLPSILPRNDTIPVVIVPPKPLKVIMEDTFSIDKTEIYKDFINKLRLIIEKYIRELLYLAEIGGFPSYKDLFYNYSVSSNDLPDNLKHIGDEIVRNQIQREQKSKFFQKIYSIDQTIYHLRANKISHELRKRYYDESYGSSKNYLDTNSNDMLRGSRLQYDKKYQQNMYNFYKYLNSAVILVDEVLQTFVKESKGKATLNKEGVDIYKGVNEEEELAEKIKKEREQRITKRRKETSEKEKKRLERYKTAGRNPNGNKYAGSTDNPSSSPVVPTGDNAQVVALALQWVQTRGVSSSNPVKYSMELRGSDMELKKYGDCSSFTRRIFLDANKGDIGWTTAQQATNTKGNFFTERSQMQPGDLMFFNPTGSHGHPVTLPNGQTARTAHVAIFIGENKMIDLSYGVGSITTKDFSSGQYKNYVDGHFIGAVRF